ncbi:hypothetical protein RYX36_034861 [Vicia faba]
MGFIDLNTSTQDHQPPSSASSSVCFELWHACAGPMISLPKKGTLVVYFPQGHLEHVHDFSLSFSKNIHIPSHVFCRVLDVKLHAEERNDEVYCQVMLVPESEQMQQKLRGGEVDAEGGEDTDAVMKTTTPHMGEDGELRLGIRRAAQLKSCSNISSLSGQQLNLGSLTDVVKALSTRCAFSVHYNPRVGSSEFIIPIHKFLKSRDYSYSVGMRFRMRFESEDAAERRCTGLIIGISDVDPVRWPGSKWKCLVVRWDDLEASRLNRISPWEIEPSGSASTTNSIMTASLKRTKIGLPSTKLEFPVQDGIGTSDFGESMRFQKVLQGQEMLGADTIFDSISARSHHQLSELRRCYPGSNYPGIASTGNSIRIPQMDSNVSCNGFGESFRFQKVLQGQEILPSQPYGRALSVIDKASRNGGFGLFDVPRSRNGWYSQTNNNSHFHPSALMYHQQGANPVSNLDYNNKINPAMEDKVCQRGSYYASEDTNSFARHSHDSISLQIGGQELVSTCKSSCRVFGFSLTEGAPIANKEAQPSAVTCQMNPGPSSFTRHVEEDFNPKHSLRSKGVESYCTKGVLQC